MTIEQIETEALNLPRHVRARLAQALLSSLDEDSEIERAWEEEAEQRYARYQRGEEEVISAVESLAELRSDLKR